MVRSFALFVFLQRSGYLQPPPLATGQRVRSIQSNRFQLHLRQ
jgi:hypothetical protein